MRTVRRYVAPLRQAATAPDPAPTTPKARQITRWLLTRPHHLQPEDQPRLNAIRVSYRHIDTLARHVASFAEMMTGRTGNRDLESWLTAAEADDGQPDLRSFAAGIRNDQQAVTNGLTLPYSSGKVEGTVNKPRWPSRYDCSAGSRPQISPGRSRCPSRPWRRGLPGRRRRSPAPGSHTGSPGPLSCLIGCVLCSP